MYYYQAVPGLRGNAQDLYLQHTGSFSCGMWDQVPQPGIEPWPPALGA